MSLFILAAWKPPPKPKPKRVRSKHPKFRKGGNGTDPEHVAPGPGEAPSFRSLPWKRKLQACLLPLPQSSFILLCLLSCPRLRRQEE
ncbi:hypothetical protein N7536_005963 [Penicillium majusculum]|nr:hypothetical protein N7536_005963 [Penicillium majusculum]